MIRSVAERLCQRFRFFGPLDFSLAVSSSEYHLRDPKNFLGSGTLPFSNQRSIVLCETTNSSEDVARADEFFLPAPVYLISCTDESQSEKQESNLKSVRSAFLLRDE